MSDKVDMDGVKEEIYNTIYKAYIDVKNIDVTREQFTHIFIDKYNEDCPTKINTIDELFDLISKEVRKFQLLLQSEPYKPLMSVLSRHIKN